jgi:hypothetical protein
VLQFVKLTRTINPETGTGTFLSCSCLTSPHPNHNFEAKSSPPPQQPLHRIGKFSAKVTVDDREKPSNPDTPHKEKEIDSL